MPCVVVEVRRTRLRNAGTLLSSLIHVSNRPRLVVGSAIGVVLVLNLVGHVIEQGLNGTKFAVGVVGHVAPLNHEHLAWVATVKGVGRRSVGVDAL